VSEYRVSNKIEEFDVELIHRFLSLDSYWLKGVGLSTVQKAMSHSVCFGGFVGAGQVSFGRAVTDRCTFAYLRDFFVLPEYRGRGYGKSLVEFAMMYLRDEGVATCMLSTQDAHGLYERFGFRRVDTSKTLMVYIEPARIGV
jgi:GNAT superfamily N-acetyltransferase